MNMLHVIILGIVQGLTEFLPVSSSAHLVILQTFFGITESQLVIDVALHVGTLLAVVIYFLSDVAWVLRDTFSGLMDGMKKACGRPAREIPRGFYLGMLVLLGSVPAAVFGILFDDVIDKLFGSMRLACLALLGTSAFLWSARKVREGGSKPLNWKRALWVGLAQALAIIPGISRSGITIVSGLWSGLDREETVRFSFFLSIVAISGAGFLKLDDAVSSSLLSLKLLAAMVVSFLVGLLAIRFLLRVIRKGRLHYFAWYCLVVGLAGFLTSFFVY